MSDKPNIDDVTAWLEQQLPGCVQIIGGERCVNTRGLAMLLGASHDEVLAVINSADNFRRGRVMIDDLLALKQRTTIPRD